MRLNVKNNENAKIKTFVVFNFEKGTETSSPELSFTFTIEKEVDLVCKRRIKFNTSTSINDIKDLIQNNCLGYNESVFITDDNKQLYINIDISNEHSKVPVLLKITEFLGETELQITTVTYLSELKKILQFIKYIR